MDEDSPLFVRSMGIHDGGGAPFATRIWTCEYDALEAGKVAFRSTLGVLLPHRDSALVSLALDRSRVLPWSRDGRRCRLFSCAQRAAARLV
jgi:hypothetical protein